MYLNESDMATYFSLFCDIFHIPRNISFKSVQGFDVQLVDNPCVQFDVAKSNM